MALRLKNFDPSHLGVLNRWASDNDTKLATHDTQIADLQGALQKLIENNPTLKTSK